MGSLKVLWKHRTVRFLVVASSCTLLQELILFTLIRLHLNRVWADSIGFAASAQANYALSGFLTWGDRKFNQTKRSYFVRMAKFNTIAIIVLGVNIGVFSSVLLLKGPIIRALHGVLSSLTKPSDVPVLVASLVGVLAGAIVSFTLNNYLTFRQEDTIKTTITSVEPSDTPEIHIQAAAAVQGKTLAYFMPAYNESDNLPHMVAEVVAYFIAIGLAEFRVLIVNDGSLDSTAAVADDLARRHPEVVVYHRQRNGGYGRALKTGLIGVGTVERTKSDQPFDLWAFSDSDRQFDIRSLSSLLLAQQETNADLVVGRRHMRESRFRYYLGRAWHFYSKLAVGRDLLVVSDVDCGMKLGRVSALSVIAPMLFGEKAAISPELIARHKLAKFVIEERRVAYLPRVAGKSTGSNPKVMIHSGLQILLVGLVLRLERYFGWTWELARKIEKDVIDDVIVFKGSIKRSEDIATELG